MKYKERNNILSKLRQKSKDLYKNGQISIESHRKNLIFLTKALNELTYLEDTSYGSLIIFIENDKSKDIKEMTTRMIYIFNT